RHIVEPSINYVYVPRPDKTPAELPQFDTELPAHRLLPLEFPDYNSIDSVDSQNTLRLGLRNKVQTKRAGDVDNVLNWALYTDWRLRPRPGQTTFPDLYSDLDFSPRHWVVLNSQVRYDIYDRDWREANHRLTLLPNDTWNWTLGHRYLRDDPATYGPGNNLISSSLYYRVNEDWGFRVSHYFESRDGVLEEQYYTVYRDLRSWTAALTLRFRDNRTAREDWAIVLTMQLKAFPRFGLGKDSNQADWLLGR
ncbi:MAG: LPS assembly protein LptD, partial [Verrucomicrobiota bacterium]